MVYLLIICYHNPIISVKPYEDIEPIHPYAIRNYKNPKDISTSNYVLQYHNEDWGFYMPRPTTDTMAVRFRPPTECSLVAFEIIHYNTTTGQVGQPYYLFVADQRMDLDYDTFPSGDAIPAYFVSPLGPKFPGYENIQSFALPNGQWDQIQCEIYIPYVEGKGKSHDFFVGYRPGTNNFAILSTGYIPFDITKNSHSYRYRNAWGRWYGYFWYSNSTKIEFGFRAYLKLLRNVKPEIKYDKLPNTYDINQRAIYAYIKDIGVPADSAGVSNVYIEVYKNGIYSNLVSMYLASGEPNNGYWAGFIPSANIGDTVSYRIIAFDFQGMSDTTDWHSYIVKSGTPGNALLIRGSRNFILDDYIELNYPVDVWDISAENGPPDHSVFSFYTQPSPGFPLVIWKGSTETALSIIDYGSGIVRIGDTLYILNLLENGGGFWLQDENALSAFGVIDGAYCVYCGEPDSCYFLYGVFGILEAEDNNNYLCSRDSFYVYGDINDPVVGSLFDGVGSQIPGSLFYRKHQQYWWPGCIYSYVNGSHPDFYAISGSDTLILALRREAENFKSLIQIFNANLVSIPFISGFDFEASDSIDDVYLKWFGLNKVGVDKRQKNYSISYPIFRSSEMIFNLTIPEPSYVNVKIFDITGRMISQIFNGKASGFKTLSYDTKKLINGTYFIVLFANGEIKSVRKFLFIK